MAGRKRTPALPPETYTVGRRRANSAAEGLAKAKRVCRRGWAMLIMKRNCSGREHVFE